MTSKLSNMISKQTIKNISRPITSGQFIAFFHLISEQQFERFSPIQLKLERTDERLTRRTGLILINRFGDKFNLASMINRAFREPPIEPRT